MDANASGLTFCYVFRVLYRCQTSSLFCVFQLQVAAKAGEEIKLQVSLA